MAELPPEISTALVHMDAPLSFIGEPGRLHVEILPSVSLVWAATGTPVVNFEDMMDLADGQALEIQLPHTDQDGFLDGAGNTITGWYYTVKITYEKDGQLRVFPERDFQVLVGQAEVDLALVPAGEAAVPQVAPVLTVTSIEGFTGPVSLAELQLERVDNTNDAEKPISTATQAALDLKAPKANPTFTGTVTGVTKSMVGLGSVDNTADVDKPISTAAQAALDAKLDDAQLGAASGVAPLDAGSKVPEAHIPTRLSDTSLNATIATALDTDGKALFSRRALSGGFELKNPWPAVHPTPPVVAHATTKASSGTQQTLPSSSPRLRTYGDPGTINLNDGGKSATAATIAGYEFTIEGSTYVEITWYESVANAHRIWIWLDGQPITAAPVATIATGTGTRVFTHITLPDSNRHEIRFYGGEIGGIGNVYAPVTAAIAPTPPRLKLLWVGDSYSDGTSHCHESFSHPFTVARMLNMELGSASVGSMGYTAGAQPMSHQTRLDRAQRFNADLLVFDGSVNDASTITKAEIKAVWDAYLNVSPNAQGIVVFGVQASSATSTLTAARATVNKTLKDAATEHPSVIAYFDMVGNADTGTVPAAWSSATTYAKGDKVTYLGSIWAATDTKATATTAPGTSADWSLLSDGFFGTGQVGTTANNGTRDIVLASDGVHPTPIGANMLANNRATHLLNALRGLA